MSSLRIELDLDHAEFRHPEGDLNLRAVGGQVDRLAHQMLYGDRLATYGESTIIGNDGHAVGTFTLEAS